MDVNVGLIHATLDSLLFKIHFVNRLNVKQDSVIKKPFRLSISHTACLALMLLNWTLLYLAKVQSLIWVREGSELSKTSVHIHKTGAECRQEPQAVIN